MEHNPVHRFINEYYSTLCASPSEIDSFYKKDSEMIIGYENQELVPVTNNYYNKILEIHNKSDIKKIFINSFSTCKLEDKIVYHIVGQRIINENQNIRFTQTFITQEDLIIKDFCILLDEEIIYMSDIYQKYKINKYTKNKKKTLIISNSQGINLNDIYDDFSKYGNIVAIEEIENSKSVYIEFSTLEQVELVITNEKEFENLGYKVSYKYINLFLEILHQEIMILGKF